MKRRHFLQFTGSMLASLGFSQLEFEKTGYQIGKVLAQNTPRKLAFLVGINDYPSDAGFSSLRGCVTDVNLQRQLLIYRFGFQPQDIITLTDAQATRENILTGFDEHLIKQAKPGDIVVFHFSGHGSQVVDPDKDFPDGLNSTFVPADSKLPANYPVQGGPVLDITGHTLFLLMKAIQTDNLTVVLDSCHSGGGTRGNFRVRSRDGGRELTASEAEYAYQEQWLSRLNLSNEEFIKQRRAGIANGVAIASTKRNQLAADAPFSDFFAGAFTYLMTQYLWQQTGSESFNNAIPNIARSTTRLSFSRQEPIFEVEPGSNLSNQPLYFITEQTPPAEAVVTKVTGDQAELWLGGIDPQSLNAFEKGAVLTVVNAEESEQGLVQLQSRQGLVGQGKLLKKAPTGTFLQERVRGIPSDISLYIGLDLSLGNEAEAAKQAISAIKRIEVLPLQQKEVHYIFGRMTNTYQQELQSRRIQNVPAVGSLGLFSPSLELVPGSFGSVNEPALDAVTRLQAKFKSLLAAHIIKLTLNTNSSRLNLAVSMTPEGQTNQILAELVPLRGNTKRSQTTPLEIPRLSLKTPLQFRIQNNESRELYISVLVIDPTGEMSVVFPNQWTATDDVMRLGAGQPLLIPDPSKDGFQLVTQEPLGMSDVLIVASTSPLRKVLQALRQYAASRGSEFRSGPISLPEPTTVVGDLLDDLAETSRGASSATANASVRSVDTTQIAAMSISFEVI